jgi:hypothetical protein
LAVFQKRWLAFARIRYRRTLSAGNASASSFAKPCSLWGLQLLRLHLQAYSRKRDASAQSKEDYSEEFVLFPLESPPFTPSSHEKIALLIKKTKFFSGLSKL